MIDRFNALPVGSLFKSTNAQLAQLVYTDFLPRRLPTRLLGADTTGCELVGFCFTQTECFSLQILSQTINTLSAFDKPTLNTL